MFTRMRITISLTSGMLALFVMSIMSIAACSTTTRFQIGDITTRSPAMGNDLLSHSVAVIKDVYAGYNIYETECFSGKLEDSAPDPLCRAMRDMKKPLLISVRAKYGDTGWVVTYISNGINDKLDQQVVQRLQKSLSGRYGKVSVN